MLAICIHTDDPDLLTHLQPCPPVLKTTHPAGQVSPVGRGLGQLFENVAGRLALAFLRVRIKTCQVWDIEPILAYIMQAVAYII